MLVVLILQGARCIGEAGGGGPADTLGARFCKREGPGTPFWVGVRGFALGRGRGGGGALSQLPATAGALVAAPLLP